MPRLFGGHHGHIANAESWLSPVGIVLAAIPLVLGIAWTALAPVMFPGMIPPLAGIAGTFAASLAAR